MSAGPTHASLGASAACWALYGDVLEREYRELAYRRQHRLTVDAYAVQHPGGGERRAVQSVAFHLMRLCLALERGLSPRDSARMAPRLLRAATEFRRLEPPVPNGRRTVVDVLATAGPEEHLAAVEAWARDVWAAWSAHHATVRGWLDLGPR